MPITGGVTFVGSNAQVGADVIKTGNILNGEIIDADIKSTAAIARTKLADVSATSKILGRKTAGAGADEEMSLSDVLDFIGSATKGDLLVRDTSAWARLAASTAGFYLTSNGAGALPTYQAFGGVTYKNGIDSHDISVTGAQTIAHGITGTPKKIKITVLCSSTMQAASHGTYNNTTVSMIYSAGTISNGTGSSSTNIIELSGMAGNNAHEAHATVAVDATNITLTWAKTNTPTGTAVILWEAEL